MRCCLSEPGISFLWDDVSDFILLQSISVHLISFILVVFIVHIDGAHGQGWITAKWGPHAPEFQGKEI